MKSQNAKLPKLTITPFKMQARTGFDLSISTRHRSVTNDIEAPKALDVQLIQSEANLKDPAIFAIVAKGEVPHTRI